MKIRATVVVDRARSLTPPAKARLILAVFGGLILIWLLVARKPWTINAPNAGAWKLSQYVAFYVWIGALIDLILATLLALTTHWWARPLLNLQPLTQQKNILTATFYGPPEPYDPNMISFRNAPELGDLVRRADAGGKILYVNLGYLTTVEGEHQNKYELLRHSGFFEDLGVLSGFEPTMQSRHVFRYIPGSAAN